MFGEQMLDTSRKANRQSPVRAIGRTATVLCIAFAVWAGASRVGEFTLAKPDVETRIVVVKSGDTLWSLAKQHGPHGWDPRRTIEVIRQLNAMDDVDLGRLLPGDQIRIPVS